MERRLRPTGTGAVKPTVYLRASVDPALAELLSVHFAHEVLLQKPIMFGSLPMSMARSSTGLPVNAHLLSFLQGGDTIVVTVGSLLSGYTFEARSIWDAIAFEEFSASAFDRFALICRHAGSYVEDTIDSKSSIEPPYRDRSFSLASWWR